MLIEKDCKTTRLHDKDQINRLASLKMKNLTKITMKID